MQCQGYKVNMGSMLGHGGPRTSACDFKPKFRVFINPPKADDDGTKVVCDLCQRFTYGTFRYEELKPLT